MCRTRDGREFDLGNVHIEAAIFGPVRAAGSYLSYITASEGGDVTVTALRTFDVRTEQTRWVDETLNCEYCWPDVVLLGGGGIAWIREKAYPRRIVVKCDAGCGTPVKLAAGTKIGPRSLGLSRGRVTWRDGSRRRSATLR